MVWTASRSSIASHKEIGGDIRAFGDALREPAGVLGGQRLRVPQPLDHIRRLAQMVLMRGEAAPGFGVGEVEGEVVGDQRQRASARGRGFGRHNRHLRLYKL